MSFFSILYSSAVSRRVYCSIAVLSAVWIQTRRWTFCNPVKKWSPIVIDCAAQIWLYPITPACIFLSNIELNIQMLIYKPNFVVIMTKASIKFYMWKVFNLLWTTDLSQTYEDIKSFFHLAFLIFGFNSLGDANLQQVQLKFSWENEVSYPWNEVPYQKVQYNIRTWDGMHNIIVMHITVWPLGR